MQEVIAAEFVIILDLGLILVFGVLGSFILKKYGVPEILGFLLVGLVVNILLSASYSPTLLGFLNPIVVITLGFVGFHIGSEIDWKTIRTMSRKVFVILVFEALGTFILVTFIVYFFTQQFPLALVLGALSSATAPAGTAYVFLECDAKGPLTATVMFVLALDDVISIILADVAIDFAYLYYLAVPMDLISLFLPVVIDVCGSVVLGLCAGLFSSFLLNRVEKHGELLVLIIGSVLACIGIAAVFNLSLILPTMIFGVTIASLVDTPEPPNQLFEETYTVVSPIVATFFLLIGLNLDLTSLVQIGVLGIIYLVGRLVAKTIGAALGSYVAGSESVITKYLGPCLYSQAGVALGLAVVISEHFSHLSTQITDPALASDVALTGALILNTITATTIIFQIIGPIAIKWALVRSGEISGEVECLDLEEALIKPEPEIISPKNDLISPDTSLD
ncbi:MAG: cation:proton antiporter [Candidatus Hermodarchaeota archaeon]